MAENTNPATGSAHQGDSAGSRRPLVTRRRLLGTGLGAAAGGAATVALAGSAFAADREQSAVSAAQDRMLAERSVFVGSAVESSVGVHQAGVTTAPQSHAVFAAFDLHPDVGAGQLANLMRILTDDISRVTSGRPALADTAAELATTPARLTVTAGFGSSLFEKVGLSARQPAALINLPAFPQIDKLEDRWCGGDLMLQICADDAVAVAHTLRMLMKDTRAFAKPRWFQKGFRRAVGSGPMGSGDRNLMGQIDGTVNPSTAAEHDDVVWNSESGWFAGGTTMVLRRIQMNLDEWDELDRSGMDQVMGRRTDNGAPLSGGSEHDEPDLAALDQTGLKAIPDFAHLRIARGDGPARQILRRPYNYDDSPGPAGESDLGQLFCSFQAHIGRLFLPMQRRLAERDLLNKWTTPVGSATFAILPGYQPGGWLGESLLA